MLQVPTTSYLTSTAPARGSLATMSHAGHQSAAVLAGLGSLAGAGARWHSSRGPEYVRQQRLIQDDLRQLVVLAWL